MHIFILFLPSFLHLYADDDHNIINKVFVIFSFILFFIFQLSFFFTLHLMQYIPSSSEHSESSVSVCVPWLVCYLQLLGRPNERDDVVNIIRLLPRSGAHHIDEGTNCLNILTESARSHTLVSMITYEVKERAHSELVD